MTDFSVEAHILSRLEEHPEKESIKELITSEGESLESPSETVISILVEAGMPEMSRCYSFKQLLEARRSRMNAYHLAFSPDGKRRDQFAILLQIKNWNMIKDVLRKLKFSKQRKEKLAKFLNDELFLMDSDLEFFVKGLPPINEETIQWLNEKGSSLSPTKEKVVLVENPVEMTQVVVTNIKSPFSRIPKGWASGKQVHYDAVEKLLVETPMSISILCRIAGISHDTWNAPSSRFKNPIPAEKLYYLTGDEVFLMEGMQIHPDAGKLLLEFKKGNLSEPLPGQHLDPLDATTWLKKDEDKTYLIPGKFKSILEKIPYGMYKHIMQTKDFTRMSLSNRVTKLSTKTLQGLYDLTGDEVFFFNGVVKTPGAGEVLKAYLASQTSIVPASPSPPVEVKEEVIAAIELVEDPEPAPQEGNFEQAKKELYMERKVAVTASFTKANLTIGQFAKNLGEKLDIKFRNAYVHPDFSDAKLNEALFRKTGKEIFSSKEDERVNALRVRTVKAEPAEILLSVSSAPLPVIPEKEKTLPIEKQKKPQGKKQLFSDVVSTAFSSWIPKDEVKALPEEIAPPSPEEEVILEEVAEALPEEKVILEEIVEIPTVEEEVTSEEGTENSQEDIIVLEEIIEVPVIERAEQFYEEKVISLEIAETPEEEVLSDEKEDIVLQEVDSKREELIVKILTITSEDSALEVAEVSEPIAETPDDDNSDSLDDFLILAQQRDQLLAQEEKRIQDERLFLAGVMQMAKEKKVMKAENSALKADNESLKAENAHMALKVQELEKNLAERMAELSVMTKKLDAVQTREFVTPIPEVELPKEYLTLFPTAAMLKWLSQMKHSKDDVKIYAHAGESLLQIVNRVLLDMTPYLANDQQLRRYTYKAMVQPVQIFFDKWEQFISVREQSIPDKVLDQKEAQKIFKNLGQ